MSLVGFRILDYNGHEKETIEFLKQVCIFEDEDTAKNIVEKGADAVNIFSRCITSELLNQQSFSWEPITVDGKNALLVSLVNFRLEISYKGTLHVLLPADYIEMTADDVPQFELFIKQGYLGAILDDGGSSGEYIYLNPTRVYFSPKGGKQQVTVISNASWSLPQQTQQEQNEI